MVSNKHGIKRLCHTIVCLQSQLTNTPPAQGFPVHFLCCYTELFQVPAHLNPLIKCRSRANGKIAALQRDLASRTAAQGSSWPALVSRSSSPLNRHHPCMPKLILPLPWFSYFTQIVRVGPGTVRCKGPDAQRTRCGAQSQSPSPGRRVGPRCVRVCVCACVSERAGE
jgi:hypothetical protein